MFQGVNPLTRCWLYPGYIRATITPPFLLLNIGDIPIVSHSVPIYLPIKIFIMSPVHQHFLLVERPFSNFQLYQTSKAVPRLSTLKFPFHQHLRSYGWQH